MTSSDSFKIEGLHHIQLAIPAGQEEACRRFWGQTLGLTELAKPAGLAGRGGCWFAGGGLEVHLEAAGATVSWDTELDGHDRFYSTDPFGNRLEFLEPKRLG